MSLDQYSEADLRERESELLKQYGDFKGQGLKLDLTRGKPSAEQLGLSSQLDGILDGSYELQDGTDVRNYGGLLGIPEARAFGADLLGLRPEEVMAGGNSSLLLMHQYVGFAHWSGVVGTGSGWRDEAGAGGAVKFLCPVPGYDRHFTICEHYGIEMIEVELDAEGPDMERVEALVASDPLIKGIWCVPRYSNPTGQTYSERVVRRLAGLGRSAGQNFRIFWDNAYAVHHLTATPPVLLNVMDACRELGTEDSVVLTASTSKITYAGAGISFLGSSVANLGRFERHLSTAMIGPDKVNQLRHVRFLEDAQHLASHMERHREIIAPKFQRVIEILAAGLAGTGLASWTEPQGGYFISLDTLPGLATRIVALAADVGVRLTPAGATFPYGRDPQDRNIRLAPTFPPAAELDQAMRVLVTCVHLASVQQQLEDRFQRPPVGDGQAS